MGVKIHQAVLVVSSSKRRKTVTAAKDASTYYCVKAVNTYVHVFFLFFFIFLINFDDFEANFFHFVIMGCSGCSWRKMNSTHFGIRLSTVQVER